MLLLGGRASQMIVLLCSAALLLETVRAGSSFLSPAKKPQGKGKPPARMGRRDVIAQGNPQEDVHSLLSPPFRLGVTMTAAEYEEHGPGLQRILDTILGDTAD
ncbi:ghrelin/obestatin prepropeptide isoform X2 [Engraulis encrasicolus]|uniref:ghrelin/obestatin prepropeptide isoform X2 n=1 Tax=Engraulis encrasicolus TaxID=184585 RepID=UPI002FD36AA2